MNRTPFHSPAPGIKIGGGVQTSPEDSQVTIDTQAVTGDNDPTPDLTSSHLPEAPLPGNNLPYPGEVPVRPSAKWRDTPLLEDQMRKAGAFKEGPCESVVFNLSLEEDLKSYNALLADCETNPDAPLKAIQQSRIDFHKGSYFVYIMYRRIKYLDLVNTR